MNGNMLVEEEEHGYVAPELYTYPMKKQNPPRAIWHCFSVEDASKVIQFFVGDSRVDIMRLQVAPMFSNLGNALLSTVCGSLLSPAQSARILYTDALSHADDCYHTTCSAVCRLMPI